MTTEQDEATRLYRKRLKIVLAALVLAIVVTLIGIGQRTSRLAPEPVRQSLYFAAQVLLSAK